ncbi:uncharacterized protein BP5553_01997 [Venustampulla echinocandica]|uniref:Uncharacterized protein n=1 Tax=Venustampulla echinocandica TaxID=2656787 RepID=A0A370U2K9_9HELO|nr:uncharacterized protein BP5553_01997 [Venustampulla echinocandica]RDL42018.1 hypothetical protein BP5553_01997 [Venustampulla echinocandica]
MPFGSLKTLLHGRNDSITAQRNSKVAKAEARARNRPVSHAVESGTEAADETTVHQALRSLKLSKSKSPHNTHQNAAAQTPNPISIYHQAADPRPQSALGIGEVPHAANYEPPTDEIPIYDGNGSSTYEMHTIVPQLLGAERHHLGHQPGNRAATPAADGPQYVYPQPGEQILLGETEVQVVTFQCLSKDCYVAPAMEVDGKLQADFDRKIRKQLYGALRRLKLNDPRISLECVMAGTKEDSASMKPAILFMCFTSHQKRAILRAFRRRISFPLHFASGL